MSLLAELKRRNVIRVALAYVVLSWVLLQVGDVVFEALRLDESANTLLLAILGLGFFPVLIFSWVFELTPDGLVRDTGQLPANSESHRTARKLDIAVLVMLVVAIVLFLTMGVRNVEPEGAELPLAQEAVVNAPPAEAAVGSLTTVESAPATSIAVLPFADLSPEGDQGYFSDGISEEILNVLVRVEGLKVASRTSSFQFKGQGALGLPLIAEELGVRHVLEGSVRKAGDTVRITAQLIDARSDTHLWSETYDRAFTAESLFAIQDDIATAIVATLEDLLGVDAVNQVQVVADTQDLDAYEHYLAGHDLFLRRSVANIPLAIERLEQAARLDPEFARAWSALAAVYSVAPSWGVEDPAGRDYTALSLEAAERALDLDDQLALPLAVIGNGLSDTLPADFEGVFHYYNQALAREPGNSTVNLWMAVSLIQAGFFERANEHLKRCLETDPFYENCKRFLALSLLYGGDVEAATAMFEAGVQSSAESQIQPFLNAYAAMGDQRATLLGLAWQQKGFPRVMDIGAQYEAMTNPDFDFDLAKRRLALEVEQQTGREFDWADHQPEAMLLKQFDQYRPNPYYAAWWDHHLTEFRQSPHRKRLMVEMGLPEYWRKHGYPPQCRESGEDDFECD